MPTYKLSIDKKEDSSREVVSYECRLDFPHTVRKGLSLPFSFEVSRKDYEQFLARFNRFYTDIVNVGNNRARFRGPQPIEESQYLELIRLRKYGKEIFNNITVDDDFRNRIFDLKDGRLNISTSDIEIPWELLFHEDQGFLALNYPISRVVDIGDVNHSDANLLPHTDELDGPLRILFVTNPLISKDRAKELNLESSDLPETEVEVRRISSVLMKAGIINESKVLSKEEATLAQIEAALEKYKPQILHYSGHNIYDSKEISQNGLVLANNQILTPLLCKELFRNHAPNIIFMNSCTSGTGSLSEHGLTRTPYSFIESFCALDVQAFIGTLWPVEEFLSADFAIDFYKYFVKGRTIGEALYSARLDSYKNKNDHCQTWAAYVLYGYQDLHISDSSHGIPSKPFKSFAAYTERDQKIFKGRAEDTADLLRDIIENKYRLIRLDGDSGAGKSSLIHAGVKPALEKLNHDVVVIDKGYEDVFKTSIKQISAKLALKYDDTDSLSFSDFLLKVSSDQINSQTVIVYDQFEKMFLEHFDADLRNDFFRELAQFVKLDLSNVIFLFVMRADYTGHFTGYIHKNDLNWMKENIGEPFLHRLSAKQAEQAIKEPLALHDCYFEDGVVEEIIDKLSEDDGRIYPPHLQIICDRLYQEIAREGRAVTVENINTNWNIQKILNDWLKDKIKEINVPNVDRKGIENVLKTFITGKGIREIGTLSPSMVIESLKGSSLTVDQVSELLDNLHKERILKREFVDDEPRYELIHDCLAQTIKSMMSDDEIEVKKAKEFLFAQNRIWLKSEKKGNKLLDFQQLSIIDSQKELIADELEPDDYEFILKSSIVSEKELEFWIHLKTNNLENVDEGTKFWWVREIINEPECPDQWKTNAIKALRFIRGKRDQESFLWDVIFRSGSIKHSEMATLSLVKNTGREAIRKLRKAADDKKTQTPALHALAFIKNHYENLVYRRKDDPNISEDDKAFIKATEKELRNTPLNFYQIWIRVNPFIWKIRVGRGKKDIFKNIRSTLFWAGIGTVLVATPIIAVLQLSFLNVYWHTHVDEKVYAYVTFFMQIFLSVCGVAIFGYLCTGALNLASMLSAKHNAISKLIGCLIAGFVVGIIGQTSFTYVMLIKFNLDVMYYFVFYQGVFFGTSLGCGIFLAQVIKGRESKVNNLVFTAFSTCIIAIIPILLLLDFDQVSIWMAVGETMRFGFGAITMAFGRGMAIENARNKELALHVSSSE